MNRTALRIVCLGLLMLPLSSCSWTNGNQYFVHWGATRDDVVIKERTSWDLTVARELFYANNDAFKDQLGGFSCKANQRWDIASWCVLQLLHNQTSISGLAGNVWSIGTNYGSVSRVNDFHDAIGSVHGSADDDAKVAPCLTLSITTAGGYNWTTRDRGHDDCLIGKHTWE